MEIARISKTPVREVWPHEAYNFTTWLQENIDLLDDDLAVPIDAESVRREQSAGSFAVDMTAQNVDGDTVVIENQLGMSDHDHLGKLLTYATALTASVAIWIVGNPRPEHVKVLAWLNDSTSLQAYMFRIQAIRIGDSPPAPLLTLIVGPSESAKEIASARSEQSDLHRRRQAFWRVLLDHAQTKTNLHSGWSPVKANYISSRSVQRAGLALNYTVAKSSTSVVAYIDKGPDESRWNDTVFDNLYSRRSAIEEAFGESLTWEPKSEGVRSRRFYLSLDLGGLDDEDEWPQISEATVDAMIRLEKAINPHITEALQVTD